MQVRILSSRQMKQRGSKKAVREMTWADGNTWDGGLRVVSLCLVGDGVEGGNPSSSQLFHYIGDVAQSVSAVDC